MRFYFLFILLLLPTALFALPDDLQQTLHIVSDSSTFNYKTGTNLYEGNVEITQGSTRLIADQVMTRNNSNHKIEEAVAYGKNKLAEYTTLPKKGDPDFHAKASVITFYPQKSTVILEGNVVVTQGENSFEGPVIIYNMKDQVVTAPASKIGRATVVIEPQKLKL